jgi:hypothetical protein
MGSDTHAQQIAVLESLYRAFQERDIAAGLALLSPSVRWPNGWEGGVLRHDQLYDYWTRQWEQIDPSVVPTAFATEPDGRVAVTVHQVVRTKEGAVVVDQIVRHVYRFAGDLIAEMEIRESGAAG